jgi:hypothetical protein
MARSHVWTINKATFLQAVREAGSVVGATRLLDLSPGCAPNVRKRIIEEGIDYRQFSKEALGKRGKSLRMNLDEVLIVGSTTTRHRWSLTTSTE